jgi:hypothetical protein
MHLLFLTTNNLATNPRLYKEVQMALGMGYRATMAVYRLGNWSDAKGKLLGTGLKDLGVKEIKIDATNQSKYQWFKWGLLERIAQFVYPLLKNNLLINALASSRRSLQIFKACANLEIPDLIIAHNLGAAYPAYKLSQKWKIPFVFDVEDYHPGEFIKQDAKNEKLRREYLMKNLLPKAAALTSASPLIGAYTLNLIGGHPNHRVVLNSFPQHEFILPTLIPLCGTPLRFDSELKLVWFSQKISFGRGLEQLFEAMLTLTPKLITQNTELKTFQLTLIGDLDPAFNQQIIEPFLAQLKTINTQPVNPSSVLPFPFSLIIHPPLTQPALHAELANHDVGLALESGKDLNNTLAISNKIIAYTQAGLYILATDTLAQKQFMAEDSGRGMVCEQTSKDLIDMLLYLNNNIIQIRSEALTRFKEGEKLKWEKVVEDYQEIIKSLT